MTMELIKLKTFNLDKIVADLNTVFQFMDDNKEHCRYSCRPSVECPVFKIMPVEYYDCD